MFPYPQHVSDLHFMLGELGASVREFGMDDENGRMFHVIARMAPDPDSHRRLERFCHEQDMEVSPAERPGEVRIEGAWQSG